MRRVIVYGVLTMLATVTRPGVAQRVDSASTRVVIAGLVVDTRERPVGDALVSLLDIRRSARTASDGTFRFDSVSVGEYVLLVRRVGFEPIQTRIAVTAERRDILIRLVPLPHTLPPVLTRAARIGVGGVVLDTDNTPVAGVDVTLNGGRKARTDDAGRFFIRTPPGRFLLQVRGTGYATQMIGVEVRGDSGREVAVWMARTPRSAAARDAAVIERLRARLLARNPVWSRLFTREDINRIGFTTLEQIVIAGSGQAIANAFSFEGECMATVDGLHRLPVWAIDAADIEFAEVYGRPPRSPRRGRRGLVQDLPECPPVYVWLRQ
ncbi:MAG: carboxypeptidase-like regulatory domain-containing protein [Gemmatimonadaceae bacterium]